MIKTNKPVSGMVDDLIRNIEIKAGRNLPVKPLFTQSEAIAWIRLNQK